jgi:hypothetical protein
MVMLATVGSAAGSGHLNGGSDCPYPLAATMRTGTTSTPASTTTDIRTAALSVGRPYRASPRTAVICQSWHSGVRLVASRDDWQSPSGAYQPDQAGYLQVLVAEFATHGPAGDERGCRRGGGGQPRLQEQRIAPLLELVGDACR